MNIHNCDGLKKLSIELNEPSVITEHESGWVLHMHNKAFGYVNYCPICGAHLSYHISVPFTKDQIKLMISIIDDLSSSEEYNTDTDEVKLKEYLERFV